MFRKYYKEANNDIKVDEALINKVIANAHKSKPPKKHYMRYAASLAAAVVVVSAAVISMPFWEKTGNDGVIIEESVISTQVPQAAQSSLADIPKEIPQSQDTQNPAVTAVPALPEKEKKENKTDAVQEVVTPESNYVTEEKEQNKSATEKAAVSTPTDSEDVQEENITDNEAPSVPQENAIVQSDNEADGSDNSSSGGPIAVPSSSGNSGSTAPIANSSSGGSSSGSFVDTGPIAGSASSGSSSSSSSGGGGGGGGSIPRPSIPTPSGYYKTSSYYGGASFASDSGAVINVTYYYSGKGNTSPVYSVNGENISVSFSSGGNTFSINATGADRSSVEEIVNSLI